MDQQEIKTGILAKIRAGKPPLQPLPDIPMFTWQGNPLENFIAQLLAFDGRAVKFRTRADALAWLTAQPEMDAKKQSIFSAADGVEGNSNEAVTKDPLKAFDLTTCVAEGELAVGEMGSIWLTDKSLQQPRCALLARKLFILLDQNLIKASMHDAYASIRPGEQQYGSFFSGPSATADIEAVHITGAQGPLALTALIYNCADAPVPPELLQNPDADKSIWVEQE